MQLFYFMSSPDSELSIKTQLGSDFSILSDKT